MSSRSSTQLGVAGAVVVGVAFGMGRWVYGLTLPDLRVSFGLSNLLLGLVASGTFAGYLAGLGLLRPVSSRWGPRAPTMLGCALGAVGSLVVVLSGSGLGLALGAVLTGSAAAWVWAPYSELVVRTAPLDRHGPLLALITTGTSAGLVAMGALSALAGTDWRLVWVAISVASVGAGVLNLLWTPRLPPVAARPAASAASSRARLRLGLRMLAPYTFCSSEKMASVVYFTYATATPTTTASPGVFRKPPGVLVFRSWSGR